MKPSSVNAGNLVTIAALVAARYRRGRERAEAVVLVPVQWILNIKSPFDK